MKATNYLIAIVAMLACTTVLPAQEKRAQDSIVVRLLDSVLVNSRIAGRSALPSTVETYLYAGKKSELIYLSQTDADIANKTGRQVFSKVPGVFVYDMDGSGNQINIATRGLDPHRGWEFNLRKDGVITNSDMYGYPASHYSMPLESIERMELVHGTGSLQYGAQFGGMLNYITKKADTSKPFSFESITTAGSYDLISSYNAVGGRIGRLTYYAYLSRKTKDGYRNNDHTSSEAEDIVLTCEPGHHIVVRLEWARSAYTYRIPGPLSDAMFIADARQATRSRNYFNPDIHVPSFSLNWQLTDQTKIQLLSSAVLGVRNSVMFDKPANIGDTINSATGLYNNRQVDIDRFNSYTTELRIMHHYKLKKQVSTLVAGIQYMNNDLHRTQLGKGTTGSDFDLTLVEPGWGRDLHLKTGNTALFAENKLQVTRSLAITTGTRVETGRTNMTGTISYYPENKIPVALKHHFTLWGAGFVFAPGKQMEVYGGWATAYRPMVFKDLIPGSLYEKVDPSISDVSGYNAEIGFRGSKSFLKWDITAYLLKENNRFGTLAQTDSLGTFYTYRTNIGNSVTRGLEIFVQADWQLGANSSISVFTSTALMHARYTDAIVKSGGLNQNISGNQVESAPDLTSRNGMTLRSGRLNLSALYSYTAATFADALNTVNPSPGTGAVGLVPAYGLLDLNAGFRFSRHVECRFNLSNLLDRQYFTKRPMFYPGPGVWSSDGRNFTASLAVRI